MKMKHLGLLVLILLVGVGGYYLWQEQVVAKRPFPQGAKILIKTDYSLCEHEDSKETTPESLKVKTLGELRQVYPSDEGWSSQVSDSQVLVSRVVDNLCEKCSKLTHLGEKGGFIAVLKGPPGVHGDLIWVTKIRTESIPDELRKKLEKGLLDIPDEETLIQVLDSLEENSGS